MNQFPRFFVEKATGKKVRAVYFPANKNLGETDADACVITLADDESGLWPVPEFQQRYQPAN